MLSQVHRCLLNIAPKYMCSKFTKNSVRNLNYPSTRGADNLHLKRPLTNSYRTSFEYQGLDVIIPYQALQELLKVWVNSMF